MEEAEALYLMGNLMRAQYRAYCAIIRAGSARAPDNENMQFHIFGCMLAVIGNVIAAVAYHAIVNLLARSLHHPIPTYMCGILLVVHVFTFVSAGITAMVIGWLLFVNDNPRHHRRLAKGTLLLIQFASSFALGMLLLASSSLRR